MQARAAGDVILAWEPGNELHATMDRAALISFMTGIVGEIRKLDSTPLPTAAGCRWCLEAWYNGADRLSYRRVSEMPPCRHVAGCPAWA
ncbi:MAG: hypothetical protein M1582_02535 [Actinobacteria bacterium]|nr:hypothetical protein [Actinomycetota bacterium]